MKRGGHLVAQEADADQLASPADDSDLLALDEALSVLEETDSQAADVVKLRYFSGLSVAQSAEALGLSHRSAERLWTYAKAFLHRQIRS